MVRVTVSPSSPHHFQFADGLFSASWGSPVTYHITVTSHNSSSLPSRDPPPLYHVAALLPFHHSSNSDAAARVMVRIIIKGGVYIPSVLQFSPSQLLTQAIQVSGR